MIFIVLSFAAFYDSIAQASGGTSHVIPQMAGHSSMEIYVNLMHAFTDLLSSESQTHLPIGIHEKLIAMTGFANTGPDDFTIDTTLGRETTFGIYVEDEEDHLIKSVSFTDSKGFLYGPYTSMSSLYDIINLKTINFPVGEAPPFDDVGFFLNFCPVGCLPHVGAHFWVPPQNL